MSWWYVGQAGWNIPAYTFQKGEKMNYEDFKARLKEEFSKNNINLNNKLIAIIYLVLKELKYIID